MAALGSCVWAYVIGSVCGIITSMDPHTLEFQRSMDDLNIIMSENHLPQEVRRRLRTYMHEARGLRMKKARHHIMQELSPALRREVEMRSNQEWMDKVYYLRGLK